MSHSYPADRLLNLLALTDQAAERVEAYLRLPLGVGAPLVWEGSRRTTFLIYPVPEYVPSQARNAGVTQGEVAKTNR